MLGCLKRRGKGGKGGEEDCKIDEWYLRRGRGPICGWCVLGIVERKTDEAGRRT